MISRLKDRKYYIDFEEKALRDGGALHLTLTSPKHLALLRAFAENAGARRPKEFYIDRVWSGYCSEGTWNSTYSRMRHLHEKLDESFDANRNGILYLGTRLPRRGEAAEGAAGEIAQARAALADLVAALLQGEEILPLLREIMALYRGLAAEASRDYVLEKVGECLRRARRDERCGEETLSALADLEDYIRVHRRIEEILNALRQNQEDLIAARTAEQRERLYRAIRSGQEEYGKALTALMDFDRELTALMQRGAERTLRYAARTDGVLERGRLG